MISSSFGLKETMSTTAMSMGARPVNQLDEEWDTFGAGNDGVHTMFGGRDGGNAIISSSTDDDWESFCANDSGSGGVDGDLSTSGETWKTQLTTQTLEAPECSEIHISTKTKIAYLNYPIPLEETFWAIPVLPSYSVPQEGIVKKEMKFKSMSKESLDALAERVEQIPPGPFVQQNVKSHVEKGGSNVKFKDIRKVSIGLCKKQLTSFRCKEKGAFFNCFAVILRMKWQDVFREMHVKVFNTGKLEIPGIPGKDSELFLTTVLDTLVRFLAPLSEQLGLPGEINYRRNSSQTVLTNSNFTANYLIDRDLLCNILRKKYRILSTYDPCSYPGVQAKFYHVEGRESQTGHPATDVETANSGENAITTVPFMVFRTGSVLIVGKFDDDVLMCVYNFTCKVLRDEFSEINVGFACDKDENIVRKVKKRFITVVS
jgi:hypothetical protein